MYSKGFLPNASMCPTSGKAPGIFGGALPGKTVFSVVVVFITRTGWLHSGTLMADPRGSLKSMFLYMLQAGSFDSTRYPANVQNFPFSSLLISTGETLPCVETLSYTSSKAYRQYGKRFRNRS
ncbi:hypothetical protein [Methylomicrobium lacus]|uniref:hypothetical protein n=1 Tax=Methylomicrobium lacus TaxID=136992 RepID=UPI0035A9614E